LRRGAGGGRTVRVPADIATERTPDGGLPMIATCGK
jgi:hypothetical protein